VIHSWELSITYNKHAIVLHPNSGQCCSCSAYI